MGRRKSSKRRPSWSAVTTWTARPDETFGGDGLVTVLLPEGGGTGYGLAPQPDGKLLVIGAPLLRGESTDFGVLRFLGDGPAAQVFAPVVRAP